MTPFLVIDLETGGVKPWLHGITQIGAVVWSEGAAVSQFHRIVKPEPGFSYDPAALAVQGVSWAQLELEGVALERALAQFANWFYDSRNLPIWAHKAEFDSGFLREAYKKTGRPDPFPLKWNCSKLTYQMLQSVGLEPVTRQSGLADITLNWGLPPFDHHSPVADCFATARVVELLAEKLRLWAGSV